MFVYALFIYYMFIPTMPWWVWRSETSFVRLSTLNTSPVLDMLTLKVTGSFFQVNKRRMNALLCVKVYKYPVRV